MELYEQIRREYEFGVGSVIGVARKLGVHRRMVREAVRNAVPAQRKKTERPAVKMAAAATLIDAILESDRKAPRKQRHTARRIFDRIRAEVRHPRGCRANGRVPGIQDKRETVIEAAIIPRRKLPNCKILLFSAQAATSGLLVKAREQGHEFELLGKPVHLPDLLAKLRTSS